MTLSEYFDISPPLIPPTCSTINAPTKATTTDVYGSSLTSVSNTKSPSTTTSTNTVRELQKTMSNSTMIYEEKTERAASNINGPSIEVSKADEDCINPSIIEISSIPSTSGFVNKTAATVKKEMISPSRSRRPVLSEDFVYKYFPGSSISTRNACSKWSSVPISNNCQATKEETFPLIGIAFIVVQLSRKIRGQRKISNGSNAMGV